MKNDLKIFIGMFKNPNNNKTLARLIRMGARFAGFTSYFNCIGIRLYIHGHYGVNCYVPSEIIDLHETK